MVTRPYDVGVIGAGPAGSAAATGLASASWHVLLIDKAVFPRDKVCGDLLSPRSLAVLDTLGCLEAVQRAQTHSIRRSAVYLDGELATVGQMPERGDPPAYGLVVPGMVLDEILFNKAKEQCVDTVEGFTVQELSVDAHRVTVSGHSGNDSGSFLTRLVIIADCAHSRLASHLGLTSGNGKHNLFALRAYFDDVACYPVTAAIFFGRPTSPATPGCFPSAAAGRTWEWAW